MIYYSPWESASVVLQVSKLSDAFPFSFIFPLSLPCSQSFRAPSFLRVTIFSSLRSQNRIESCSEKSGREGSKAEYLSCGRYLSQSIWSR